jgi:arginyl-tRNA---protein transferase
MQKSFPEFKYYYLGYYIQSCTKMVYKGDFEPSELLCPFTYTWVTLDKNTRDLINKDGQIRLSPQAVKLIDEMMFD